MQFHNPYILPVGGALFAAAYILFRVLKRRRAFKKGLRVANTALLEESKEYKRARNVHRITGIVIECCLIVAVFASMAMIARPYRMESINQGVRKRDIFLCMDNGIYLDTLNEELLDELTEVVDSLEGDRFGISIYCASSLLYVPMTDDYSYIKKKLEDLKDYFRTIVKLDQVYGAYGWNLPYDLPESMKADFETDYARYEDQHAELTEPTYLNAYNKGYFLVGDGLASCMYSFPKFGAEDRSRIVLLSTENTNDVNARPLVTLSEACDLCAKNKVTVFGLFRGEKAFENSLKPNNVFVTSLETENDYATARADLEKNVQKTGGELYEYGVMPVSEIVEDIRKQKAMLVNEVVVNKEIDQPYLPTVVLVCALCGFAVAAAVKGG
ncbi:MAG: BatA and WFA domain-containing protein [Lachnospiraceae bacterium]|nr:BatA and WFA domain-containing protein [Lachnospiraceae bacterium]